VYRKIEEWKLLRVCDGDTFVVRWQGMDMRCRLMGIDAPEDGQPGFREALESLQELMASPAIAMWVRGSDRYGRWLVDVLFPAGESVQEVLLWTGVVWADPRSTGYLRGSMIQARACKAKRGIWASFSSEPPWKFRSRRHAHTIK